MKFGEKLKSLRDKHNLTQEDLSAALNKFSKKKKPPVTFTVDQIKQWETDKNLPNVERSLIISKFFGISLDILFDDLQPLKLGKISLKQIVLN